METYGKPAPVYWPLDCTSELRRKPQERA